LPDGRLSVLFLGHQHAEAALVEGDPDLIAQVYGLSVNLDVVVGLFENGGLAAFEHPGINRFLNGVGIQVDKDAQGSRVGEGLQQADL
jgi:hypothetical protein